MRGIGQTILGAWIVAAALLTPVGRASAQGWCDPPSCCEPDECPDPFEPDPCCPSPSKKGTGTSQLGASPLFRQAAEPCHGVLLEKLWQPAAPRTEPTAARTSDCGPHCGETLWFEPLPDDGGMAAVNPDSPNFCDEADVGPDTPWEESFKKWWTRDLSVFGGIHGFKGPMDAGQNGNFGFHEGFNFGAPVGLFDWGWQLGAEAVHSNFSGDQAVDARAANRNQFYVTAGLFKRARGWGFQWGVTYDWLHDAYYAQTDLKQIRSDSSFLFPGGVHELGYFGAYGTGGTNFVLINRQTKYLIYMEPTDVFAFYYRRYFSGGGDGRLWAGWSGRGDGIFGGELRVPLGTNWALENRFNYLIPKQGNGAGGALQESWGVTIDLVWYPGHPSRCERYHPYRPVLNVADNTLFMTDTFVP